jgi:hypothetical protein
VSDKVCPCVSCEVDRRKGRSQQRAKWRDNGLYWAPYGFPANPVTGVPRALAHLFGPQHAAELRRNRSFVLMKPVPSPVTP